MVLREIFEKIRYNKYIQKNNTLKQVNNVLESSEQIIFDDTSKIILMSDCHRGDGSWADNFSKNKNIYFRALNYYYKHNFTYIEIGDGDELWENKFSDILHIHSDIFWLLYKFYSKGRLYLIFGNHDIVKKNNKFANNIYHYLDEQEKICNYLFQNIKFHEGLVLRHRITNKKILLIHGHQVDYLNNEMWKLSRFLVRYLWKPLELFGVNDPTSTAKNYKKKKFVEKKLVEWVIKEKYMLISGHTHRPVLPKVGEPPYFNDGSCVHPRSITGIEIQYGYIMLVQWKVNTRDDGTLFIDRKILAGPAELKEYFKYL